MHAATCRARPGGGGYPRRGGMAYSMTVPASEGVPAAIGCVPQDVHAAGLPGDATALDAPGCSVAEVAAPGTRRGTFAGEQHQARIPALGMACAVTRVPLSDSR